MTVATPTPTPTAIHFQLSSLALWLGVDGMLVVSVGEKGLNRASTRDMVAPIAVSSSDLCVTTMSTSVLRGNIEIFPMKSPRGCCT